MLNFNKKTQRTRYYEAVYGSKAKHYRKIDNRVFREAKKTVDQMKGKGSAGAKWKRAVYNHLNRVMPKKEGRHRDHIIPSSLCRRMGLTPEMANHPENLQYVCGEENMHKWAEVDLDHLVYMCMNVWTCDLPSKEVLMAHARAAGNGKNMGKNKKVL